MRRSVVAAATLAVGLVLGLVLVPFASPAGAYDGGAEQQFVDLINQSRAANGLGALAVRAEIVPVAEAWTTHLIADGTLSHNPSLASQMPSDWQRIGENVGYGSSVDSLHTAFMNSPGHRANILGDYNQLGVGVDRDGSGRMWVTVDFLKSPMQTVSATSGSSAPAAGECGPNVNPPSAPSSSGATGYYVLGSDGAVFSYGNAVYQGSAPELGLHIDASLMTLTPSGNGYWVEGADGGIFSFGDATFHGSVPGLGLPVRVTAIDLKPTPSGQGYWILGADGGIFSFGDAQFFGSLPGVGVRNRAIRLIPTPSGNGYWILGADGGIFSFGDAGFYGSVPGLGLRATGISMARTIAGAGYWILGSDGAIFSFGDAGFYGSVPGLGLCSAVRGVQISPSVDGAGYYIVGDTGRVFAFGDAPYLGDPAQLGVVARDVAAVRH
ncbi:MAG TPA: CAP domain-containing protein [Acidimicrobiales bacterium]|nr:CAP domain-containing protein [Acidimicrobiales bacterium]